MTKLSPLKTLGIDQKPLIEMSSVVRKDVMKAAITGKMLILGAGDMAGKNGDALRDAVPPRLASQVGSVIVGIVAATVSFANAASTSSATGRRRGSSA